MRGSACWLLRVLLKLCFIETLLDFGFLLLPRGWHQELLPKDWLQITRAIHGKDAKAVTTPPTLMQSPPRQKIKFKVFWILSREAELNKWTHPVPWQGASPSSYSCGDWKLLAEPGWTSADQAHRASGAQTSCTPSPACSQVTCPVSKVCMKPAIDLLWLMHSDESKLTHLDTVIDEIKLAIVIWGINLGGGYLYTVGTERLEHMKTVRLWSLALYFIYILAQENELLF